MANLILRNHKTNTVIQGTANNYCKMCIDREMVNSDGQVPLVNIKSKLNGKLIGQKVYKMRLTGVDYYFCKECWKKVNDELNPKEEE